MFQRKDRNRKKYLLLIPDGVADRREDFQDGETPLEKAKTETLDTLASCGFLALAKTIPHNMDCGSDIGTMSVLGYDPKIYHKGRAPLEIAAKDIKIPDNCVVFRMNFVSVSDDNIMLDHSAGHISDKESYELLELVKKTFENERMKFYFGKSYRNYLVWVNGEDKIKTTPPHDIIGKNIDEFLPTSEVLRKIMKESKNLLKHHRSAKMVWFWGQGRNTTLPLFKAKSCMVSAVDLVKGIGKLSGITVLDVPGVTGYIDTNFEGKVDAVCSALEDDFEFGIIHIEATDETSHEGELSKKIKSIELFDEKVVRPVLERLSKYNLKILIYPDHRTPLKIRTHSNEPVPFLIYPSDNKKSTKKRFTENYAEQSKILFRGTDVIKYFLK